MKTMVVLSVIFIFSLGGVAHGSSLMHIFADDGNANSSFQLFAPTGEGYYGFEFQYQAANDRLLFLSNGTSGTDVPRMCFEEDGDIGIGTTAPSARVEVFAESSVSDPHVLLYEDDSDDYARLSFQDEGSSNYFTIAGRPGATAGLAKLNIYHNGYGNIMTFVGDGGVGIGTTDPEDFRLLVKGPESSSPVATFLNEADSADVSVMELSVGATTPGEGNEFIRFLSGTNSTIANVTGNGGGSVAYNTTAADFAEWLPMLRPEEDIEPGDIVAVIGGKITKSTEKADHFQVVSTAPGWLGACPGKDREHLYRKVAFLGQVPVKVWGQVNAGDYIVASNLNDGTGRAVPPGDLDPDLYPKIVGRAWTGSRLEEPKLIQTAVSLNAIPHELQREKDQRIERLSARVEMLERLLTKMLEKEDRL